MINSREWLRSRKNLLDQIKSQVQMRLGPMSRSLLRYAESLGRDFGRGWAPTTLDRFSKAIARSKIVLCADFHAYAQSQRAHYRVLRDHMGDRAVVLVLECLLPRHEEICADFLAGEISEADFLTAVDWEKNWGFPWENYRPLFELARDRGFEVRGALHPKEISLSARDIWTCRRLNRLHREFPHHLIFVVMGELHLAMAHLPRRLGKLFRKDEIVIVHQDVEPLYFRLASRGKEGQAEILGVGRNRFCLMVSPPWMKWQSYLMFLEHTYDRDLQEGLSIDYTEHVVSLVDLLKRDLKVEIKTSNLEVYCPSSKTSLSRLRFSLSRKEQKALRHHLEGGLSFFLPQKNWCYLSRPTINHASGLAGQFVHAHLCKRTRTLWNLPEDFLPLIWTEAVGFFFSKWINPKRKAESLETVRLQLASQSPRDRGRQALLLALDHRLSEVLWIRTGRMRPPRYRPRDLGAHLDAARILGGMLGERLFQKVRSRTISLSKLMSYLKMNVDRTSPVGSSASDKPGFAKFYWQLVREIEHDQSL